MSYAIVRNEKLTRAEVNGKCTHNDRKAKCHTNKDIDPTRTHLNYYIKKNNSSASFIFNYAAGCIKNNEYNLSNIYKTTSFKVSDKGILKESEYDFPLLCIEDEKDVIFKGNFGSIAKKTVNKRLYIYNTVPFLDVKTIRELYKISGCHIYTPENLVIYGDERFIAVLADENEYNDFIHLKKARKWKNVLNGETGQGEKIKITLKPFECGVFIFE